MPFLASKKFIFTVLGILTLGGLIWAGLNFPTRQREEPPPTVAPLPTVTPPLEKEETGEEKNRFGLKGEILEIDLERKVLTVKSIDKPQGKLYKISLQKITSFEKMPLLPAAPPGTLGPREATPQTKIATQSFAFRDLKKGQQIEIFYQELGKEGELVAEKIYLLPYPANPR